MITQCGGCGQKVWDNRSKKASDPAWANSYDFTCRGAGVKGDKGCGWKYNLPVGGGVAQTAPQGVPAAQPAAPGAFASYWACFDEALRGVNERKLVELVKGDGIVKIAATLFINQSK